MITQFYESMLCGKDSTSLLHEQWCPTLAAVGLPQCSSFISNHSESMLALRKGLYLFTPCTMIPNFGRNRNTQLFIQFGDRCETTIPYCYHKSIVLTAFGFAVNENNSILYSAMFLSYRLDVCRLFVRHLGTMHQSGCLSMKGSVGRHFCIKCWDFWGKKRDRKSVV